MPTKTCRLCDSASLSTVIDLGFHPLADTFLPATALEEPETRYPLRVLQCERCGYLGSDYVVSPEKRYQEHEYTYDSSNSPVATGHFSELAGKIQAQAPLVPGDLAVDIGSNVGTLLGYLKEAGMKVAGIEPSNLASVANERGIETLIAFFDEKSADQLLAKHGAAKAISLTNVFNHIERISAFFSAAERLLDPAGALFIEVPYVPALLEKTAFDTIYLEHVTYFSLSAFYPFLKERGWHVYGLETNEYMGGSILVTLGRDAKREDTATVQAYLAAEKEAGIQDPATYAAFMVRVRSLKTNLLSQLIGLKREGRRIAGLGAATKGNTLLNYCGITSDLVECVLESSPYKIGKYTPGSHLPIRDEKDLDQSISHLLILPWNIGAYLKQKLGHLPVEFIIPQV